MRYSQDPYWLRARYAGTCVTCHILIARGSRAWYWPSSRVLACSICGEAAERRFAAEVFDEEACNG